MSYESHTSFPDTPPRPGVRPLPSDTTTDPTREAGRPPHRRSNYADSASLPSSVAPPPTLAGRLPGPWPLCDPAGYPNADRLTSEMVELPGLDLYEDPDLVLDGHRQRLTAHAARTLR